MLQAKNGRVRFPDTDMDYVRFGTGEKVLILLPGLGDGLRSMKGMALPVALMYRQFAREYTVYVFSRKNLLREGASTRDMARDLKKAMDALKISKADVIGVSMGGMIAQWLAIDFPQAVGKLVLAVTCPRSNPIAEAAIQTWIDQARRGDHTALMDSNVRLIYSENYYRKNKWMIPIMGKATKPRSYDRFLVQARACLTHNCYDALERIHCPTLIIGGGKDRVLGAEASRELAERIPESTLVLYENQGHGLYDEEKDFFPQIQEFLTR